MRFSSKYPKEPAPQMDKLQLVRTTSVLPANKRRIDVIVIGSGLAGASAAATLGELGYNVKCFRFQDSPRCVYSIATEGGNYAAKNYQNDGDKGFVRFYDTIKGGDYRAVEVTRASPCRM